MREIEARSLPTLKKVNGVDVPRGHTDAMLASITNELECITISRAIAYRHAPKNEDGDRVPRRAPARKHNREVVKRIARIWEIVAEHADAITNLEFDNLTRRMSPVLQAEQQNMAGWLTAEVTAARKNQSPRLAELVKLDTDPTKKE